MHVLCWQQRHAEDSKDLQMRLHGSVNSTCRLVSDACHVLATVCVVRLCAVISIASRLDEHRLYLQRQAEGATLCCLQASHFLTTDG